MNNEKKFQWNKELIQECIDEKQFEKLNIQDKYGDTGFTGACVHQTELAIKMLEYDHIDFNIQNKYGDTGFMLVCHWQPKLIIPLLENKKIDTTLKNNEGQTGWDIAKEKNNKIFQIYKTYLENQKLSNNIPIKKHNTKLVL